MDMDDVLVNFSEVMYGYIRKHWKDYSRFFVDLGPLTYKEIQQRSQFEINKFLLRADLINTEEDIEKMTKLLRKDLAKTFFQTDIYSETKLTNFAKRTIMNSYFINNKTIEKVYILSRNMTLEQSKSKKAFVEKYFKHPKIEYVDLGNKNKGEWLKNNNINWSLFVDDELKNIISVVGNYSDDGMLNHKEILIPEYGYNKFENEYANLKEAIEGLGGIVSRYDEFKEN